MPIPALLAIPAALTTVITIVQFIFTIVALVAAVVQVIGGFDMALSFATDIKGPAASIMDAMYSTIVGFLPFSFDTLFTSIDNALGTSENGVFNPPLTFNGFLNTIAFKEVFNTVMMSFINGLLFVLNVRFLRWSINRLGMRFRTGGGVT